MNDATDNICDYFVRRLGFDNPACRSEMVFFSSYEGAVKFFTDKVSEGYDGKLEVYCRTSKGWREDRTYRKDGEV